VSLSKTDGQGGEMIYKKNLEITRGWNYSKGQNSEMGNKKRKHCHLASSRSLETVHFGALN